MSSSAPQPLYGTDQPPSSVRARIDANRAAVAQAEQADVRAAIDGERWERRGVLQRLRRVRRLRQVS
jgi:hypothetical protein